jgi:hypothetical protein
MRRKNRAAVFALLAFSSVGASIGRADYESHPELRPEVRCAGLEDASRPSGYSDDCQALLWDLPPATHVGERAVDAREPVWGFPGGRTDRPPPLYTDGTRGYERPGAGRTPLCPDPADSARADADRMPWWAPTGEKITVDGPYGPEEHEIREIACRRGTRAYYGPWSLGTQAATFDTVVHRVVRFENSARIGRDMAEAGTKARRVEMNVASESFVHAASHHVDCYLPIDRCNQWTDPELAASPECAAYQAYAEDCPADFSRPCTRSPSARVFRMTSSRQGRYTMDLPAGRGFASVEDPLWYCGHHVVNELPPVHGTRRRNFRNQRGGAVGEIVLQFFTEPVATTRARPASVTFDILVSALRTYIPPFTIGDNGTTWYAPFDLAIGMITLHSHERMVRGIADVVPANPIRPAARNAACGGSVNGVPQPIYTNESYTEPNVCDYWKEPDGPLILRKGQGINFRCLHDNGVTPEAIKHGLVAGSTIEGLKPTLPIPGAPALGPASTWGDLVAEGPLGKELLYGNAAPSRYRVKYECQSAPYQLLVPLLSTVSCPPNPAVDADGDPIDGAYAAPEYCGTAACAPATLRFSDTAGDAMCVPIMLYWPLDRIVDENGHVNDQAVADLGAGRVDEVGTPGRIPKSPSDPQGICDDGAGAPGCDATPGL